MKRTTVAQPVKIQGTGLHRGGDIDVVISPGTHGIRFVKDGISIPAQPDNIVDTRLNTTIGAGEVRIATIEHLLSALYGLGITDCEIAVSGDEIPAMDGSALPFVDHIQRCGIRELDEEVSPIVIDEALREEKGDSWVEIVPGAFSVSYGIDFAEQAIGRQHYTYEGRDYVGEIAPARTFGLLRDVEMMRSLGLAQGGGLHNAVVVDGADVLNPEGLRFADEFIRHKILDILGDLWTLGAPVVGAIQAYKASHALHIRLAAKIHALYRRDR
ncbi:MAG TPA: UDP-3-O-acyl-N-acetylglucosamine deacetylase [Deltaproteobacteria bacterium]|nr:UDP-3-O-acyl-N-acetylglucosamine deacetylase [Deltaproteobacteria bacterium]